MGRGLRSCVVVVPGLSSDDVGVVDAGDVGVVDVSLAGDGIGDGEGEDSLLDVSGDASDVASASG